MAETGDLEARGHVVTVLGPVAPAALGPTLLHEHLLCDLTPPATRDLDLPQAEITLETVFDFGYRPGHHHGNHRLRDVGRAAREATLFREAGGGTIVDVTTGGIRPDPQGLVAIAQASGIHVVMGAGFYTEPYLDPETLALPTEALTEIVVGQVERGAWGTAVRCGIIGEIGCSWPLTPFEARSLRAAARAQAATGAAITIHPGRDRVAPFEILDILEAEGADPGRVVVGHMDRTLLDVADVIALARRGAVVEYDFFGIEHSNYWLGILDIPNDWMRIRAIRALFEAGLGDRVAISHDICTRSRLRSLGGHGYGHILSNAVPLMRDRGFVQAEIDRMLVDTPRRLLTIGAS
ncbi:phosphotriesterase family protein [Prosthecomicrobium sp. N25]|uniref:phosphotriesterase family protein n=1 Tax=Prosthecomicrobium sp. N25 TaxID=3129254 RepID=UPI0030789CE7